MNLLAWKPLYACSLGYSMDRWQTVRVGDIAARITKGSTPTTDGGGFTDVGVSFVKVESIHSDGRIDRSKLSYITQDMHAQLGRSILERGDILFTIAGTIGRVARVDDSLLPANTNQAVAIIRPDFALADSWYVMYALRDQKHRKAALGRVVQSVQANLSLSELGSLRIALPPLRVQKSISALLEALDAKISANDLVGKTSQELMAATFDAAVAKGAATRKVREVAEIFDGPHATPKKVDAGPWYLSISSLQGGRLVLGASAHLSESDFKRWTRRATPSVGDLLFSYETRLGEAALMPSGVRGCLGRRMALLRPLAGTIGPHVLAQAFRGAVFQRTIRQRAIHGATVDRISLTDLPLWPIELPSNADGQLESMLAFIDERVEQAERESALLAQLRDTLLPLLVSGKVRVRDAEWIAEEVL